MNNFEKRLQNIEDYLKTVFDGVISMQSASRLPLLKTEWVVGALECGLSIHRVY